MKRCYTRMGPTLTVDIQTLNMCLVSAPSSCAGTPAERLNALLGQLLAGTVPCTADVVQCIVDLKQQADLYVPEDLEEHLNQAAGMDVRP